MARLYITVILIAIWNYQRLLEANILTESKRQELAATYYGLNPITLLKQINEDLEHLWLWQNALPINRGKSKLVRFQ